MIGKRRLLSVFSIVATSLVCGGVAMAATGGLPTGSAPGSSGVHAADVTDSTGVSTTSVDDSSTTSLTGTTETSMPGDTTTTEVSGVTSTTVSSPTTSVPCKPGWGYGDTNHCHSGPPGLNNKPQNAGAGHGTGAGTHGNSSHHGQGG